MQADMPHTKEEGRDLLRQKKPAPDEPAAGWAGVNGCIVKADQVRRCRAAANRGETVIQFLADQIDQLDLALDQLALQDRNFDRFAMMLTDNVVELTLHRHAEDTRVLESDLRLGGQTPGIDQKIVSEALGARFDGKVKLARTTGLIDAELSATLLYLHGFRNTAYHRGARHEGVLHSVSLFYVRCACEILARYQPLGWYSASGDKISHRAVKYLGSMKGKFPTEPFGRAWAQISEVALHLGDRLVADLHCDMQKTIETFAESLGLLAQYPEPGGTPRSTVIIESQVWHVAFSSVGEDYARVHGGPTSPSADYVRWIEANFPWIDRVDPVPSWRRRAATLAKEKNPHSAVKKYCDFMRQSEMLREAIDAAAAQLNAHLNNLVDSYLEEQALQRGKP